MEEVVDIAEAELNQYNNNKLMPLFSITTQIGESTIEDRGGKESSKSWLQPLLLKQFEMTNNNFNSNTSRVQKKRSTSRDTMKDSE